jgi:hypothetical protein
MSSYASYCHDQAAYCVRRARLASSPEVVAYCRNLAFRWLKLAARAQEQEMNGPLGRESDPAARWFPLLETPATYPVGYRRRAEQLIARGALSLRRSRKVSKLSHQRA